MWKDCGKSRCGREYQGLSLGHVTSERMIRHSSEDVEYAYTSMSQKYKEMNNSGVISKYLIFKATRLAENTEGVSVHRAEVKD